MVIAIDFDGTLCEIDYPNIGNYYEYNRYASAGKIPF